MTQPRTTGLALCPRCNQPSRLSTIGGECLSCTMEAKPPRTLEEIADEAMLNSARATDNMQWCNSVKTVILAALREAADAAVKQEREASQHGPVQQRCACPGCEARIPACWASVLCRDCLAEDCDHDARSRSEEPKPQHAADNPRKA